MTGLGTDREKIISEDAVEAAANAIARRYGGLAHDVDRNNARAALLAAVPHIEAAIRETIAAEVTREMAKVKRRWHEQCAAGHDTLGASHCSVCKELDAAARVARGGSR
jgi:hypothetical protein